jgi:hypothetical protein
MDNTNDISSHFESPGPGEKPLARGLDEVAFLFLSQATPPPPKAGPAGDASGSARAPAAAWVPLSAAVAPASASNRAPLVTCLQRHPAALEEGLRTIDADLPMEAIGPVDVLCVDRFNQLTIIDVDPTGHDALLLRGICHLDWFARNAPLVRRMYPGQAIDLGSEPRLILIGPNFSPAFRCVTQRITCIRITCLTYDLVTLPNGTGVFFKPA